MTSSRAARSRAAPTTRRRSRRVERVPKVNDVVDIWWATDKTFYRGRLTEQHETDTSFRIIYDDGETEDIDLVNEHWKFADGDNPLPPDSEQIIDVVLDGSHHQSLQQSKPPSNAKKPKPKSTKLSSSRNKSHQSSDDERDKDYVAEEELLEPSNKQKRSKNDSDKPKKRPKKARKQPAASDKTSCASRPPPKTSSESRQLPQSRVDHPDSTAQQTPVQEALSKEIQEQSPDAISSPEKKVAPAQDDSKHTSIFHDGTNALHTNKNHTQSVNVTPTPKMPSTRPSFQAETPHMAKSQKLPKPAKSKTAAPKIAQPRTTGDSASQLPTSTPSTGSQRLADTVATSQQPATGQQSHVVSQRDLAIIQAEPSLLPAERPTLPASTDATASASHPVIGNDAGTPFASSKQVTSAPLPSTPASATARATNSKNIDEEMVHEFPAEEGPSSNSIPVKVAIRPKSGRRDLSGSGISDRSGARGDASTDHSGIEDDANAALVREDCTVGKRAREDGDVVDSMTATQVNGDVRPKRPKTSGTTESARAPAGPDRVNPLTHFPEHDATLATLVNRRLNPIEKHIRSLSEDMHLLGSNVESQRKVNEDVTQSLQRLEQVIRNEVRAIQDELRSAQADRQHKQQEIIKLLREMKEGLRVPASYPGGQAVGAVTFQRSTAPNGYNIRSPEYQQSAAAPGRPTAVGVPQISHHRDPLQDIRPPVRGPQARGPQARGPAVRGQQVRGPPLRNGADLPGGVNSDDDVNVSPRRVVAPLPNATRGSADMAAKVNQLPAGPKFRITSVVARQITVWLLETPHEYDPNEGLALELWARQTSAGAFERVAERLSHFDSYVQAYQTLSTSLGNDAVEMSWFMRPEDESNVMRARRNYAAWDPPPSNSEWQSECVLLREIANGFHRALENHVWRNEDDLTAAVLITKSAAAWYGFGGAVDRRQPNGENHVAVSQARRSDQATHHNGAQFIRTAR